MLAFTINIYQGYNEHSIRVSGYNYGTNYWHRPQASLISSSSNDNFTVYFGYDSEWNLWVGIKGEMYTGISITNVVEGFSGVGTTKNLFTITPMSSLTGTIEHEVIAYAPINKGIMTLSGTTLTITL